MAGEAHIKVAIAEIQRAIGDKQQEILRVRSDLDRERKAIESENDHINNKILFQNSIIADGRRTAAQRALASTRMNQLRHEIDENRKRMNDLNTYYNNRIKGLEGEVMALNGEISSMQRLR